MTTPFSLENAPALIEVALPAQKLSAEAQKERKAGAGQTLTALGSYWKGRKPLILAKACILGCLLPATKHPEKDLDIFEKLMGMDDYAFGLRANVKPDQIVRALPLDDIDPLEVFTFNRDEGDEPQHFPYCDDDYPDLPQLKTRWKKGMSPALQRQLKTDTLKALSLPYRDKLAISKRPEEFGDELYEHIWEDVNAHLGTDAHSFPELVEQLGIMRYGQRPKVADTFCGGGSIPFEAARLGCDVYASDLNPIACMLTWGALNIVGADAETHEKINQRQKQIVQEVDAEITRLGVEHNERGDRAKAFLYCLETRCPQTGWTVPMLPSRLISISKGVYAKLIPNEKLRKFDIEIVFGATQEELTEARIGTVRDGYLVYKLHGEVYSSSIKMIRGDSRKKNNFFVNKLRQWSKEDFRFTRDDIFQERLYCIQWITEAKAENSRNKSYFSAVTQEDLEREKLIEEIVFDRFSEWQESGFIPDMEITLGEKTDELIRTRGWRYWHQLFTPRQLLILSLLFQKAQHESEYIAFNEVLNYSSRLCRWGTSGKRIAKDGSGKQIGGANENSKDVFSNQALNPLFNYGNRSFYSLKDTYIRSFRNARENPTRGKIFSQPAENVSFIGDLFVTDPPYGDSICYHEITEFFTSWIRNRPPEKFADWIWDTRRTLAIKGDGYEFRRQMAQAYSAMANHMPSNGMQVVMFTHQDASVWADMASIIWGSGLRVTAAWYIATETSSELKKGGYVQGTVLLVLRKRTNSEQIYKDELVLEIRKEVERQINTMVGLNQTTKKEEQQENLFEDADLQMAGFAAALKVLTSYTHIDSTDMTQAALRPRQAGETSFVDEIIELAVQIANEILVPEGLEPKVWENLTGSERFYLKMLDVEAAGIHKLDNYQNFAKAFRVRDYAPLMGSQQPNAARLKSAQEFKRSEFLGSEFATSPLRAILYALYEIQTEVEADDVLHHLWENCRGKYDRRNRQELRHLCSYLAQKLHHLRPDEASAARILSGLLETEHL